MSLKTDQVARYKNHVVGLCLTRIMHEIADSKWVRICQKHKESSYILRLLRMRSVSLNLHDCILIDGQRGAFRHLKTLKFQKFALYLDISIQFHIVMLVPDRSNTAKLYSTIHM